MMLGTPPSASLSFVLLAVLSFAAAGCADDESATVDGAALYATPHDDGNSFACATCHALTEPASDGLIRPGHPIGDAANRGTYKNGQLPDLLSAVNTCRRQWMNTSAFAADDARWLALESFLKEQAGGAGAAALTFEIVDPPADVNGGDPTAGEDTFHQTCVVCHGDSGVGSERAPAIAGTMLAGEAISLRVRRSGDASSAIYPGLTGGAMPFWAADRLSDQQLRDVLAFLAMSEPPSMPNATGGGDLSVSGAQDGCGSSDPKVGQSLTFASNAHSVGGTATIVDDCTIELAGFSFDGGGIDVRVLAGLGGDYAGGVPLTDNLVGSAFDGSDATIRLPAGVTLPDLDGLSVWCIPVGFSFGDGQFQ